MFLAARFRPLLFDSSSPFELLSRSLSYSLFDSVWLSLHFFVLLFSLRDAVGRGGALELSQDGQRPPKGAGEGRGSELGWGQR